MTMDRERSPYALGFGHSKPINGPDGTYRLFFADDNETDPTGYIEGSTYDECLANAWAWYDRITLPARVALLRELAAEMREGTSDLADAVLDSGSFFGPKRRPEDILDERADALESGSTSPVQAR